MTSKHEASVAAGLDEVMRHPRGRAYLSGVLLARGDAVAVLARTRNLIRGYEALHPGRGQQQPPARPEASPQPPPQDTATAARQAIADLCPPGTDPARIEQAVARITRASTLDAMRYARECVQAVDRPGQSPDIEARS